MHADLVVTFVLARFAGEGRRKAAGDYGYVAPPEGITGICCGGRTRIRAMDWVFIGTGPGERFAHDQLSRFESQSSKEGRELARTLEKKH